MSTFLFDKIIFGPVTSRRLGVSLGVNLLPTNHKICSFNCIYCECGLNQKVDKKAEKLPKRQQVKERLNQVLLQMQTEGKMPDVITFAGNGEPTLHPDFADIINDTIELRNILSPNSRIAVLSNASKIKNKKVFNALLKVDDNILKLDSGVEETIIKLDKPVGKFNLRDTVEDLKKFNGQVTIQTLFVKGEHEGEIIDNTTDYEVEKWLELIKEIKPKEVMIYTIDRETPIKTLEKIPIETLNRIAEKVNLIGFKTQVSG